MGAACQPSISNERDEECNMKPIVEDQNSDQFTKVINNYKAENEKLKLQLEDVKSENELIVTGYKDKSRQNEEVMSELENMRAMIDRKKKVLVRGRLEAALLSKATSMLAKSTSTKLCMRGNLMLHFRKGVTKLISKKYQWVEIHMVEGTIIDDEFRTGCVMLFYSDYKDASISNKCRILDLRKDESDKNFTFTISGVVEGLEKEMTFSCVTNEEREEWVQCITDALAEVLAAQHEKFEVFTLKIEITKKKLGIRIEESLVDHFDHGLKSEKTNPDDVNKSEGRKESNSFEDTKVLEYTKEQEKPCQLLVTSIMDHDLVAAGLVLNCTIAAINDIQLAGMGFSEQLNLLMATPKPFTLTFMGYKIREDGNHSENYTSILKELVADEENSVKNAFYELVRGTPFEVELESSDDKVATITNLLGDQRRLLSLLHNFEVQDVQL